MRNCPDLDPRPAPRRGPCTYTSPFSQILIPPLQAPPPPSILEHMIRISHSSLCRALRALHVPLFLRGVHTQRCLTRNRPRLLTTALREMTLSCESTRSAADQGPHIRSGPRSTVLRARMGGFFNHPWLFTRNLNPVLSPAEELAKA